MRPRSSRDDLFDRVAPNCGSGVIVMMVGLIALFAGWQQGSSAALAFGGALFLVPAATWLLLRRLAADIVLRQSVPPRVFEGDQLEVLVSVEGKLPPPGFDLRLSERPGVARGWIRTLTFGETLSSDDGRERRYLLRCEVPRGLHGSGEAYMRLGDPFGWFEFRRPLRNDNRILVLPRILALPAETLRAVGIARMGPGLVASASGHSLEFRGLRPYRSGDPRTRVHWKQTARSGQLIVREDEMEHEGGLVLLLDLDLADDARGVGRSTLDRAARFVASVVVAARRQGLRTGFIFGPTADDRLDVAGDGDVPGLLETLALLQLARSEILPQTLDALPAVLGLPCRLLVVSTAASLARFDLRSRVERLRRRGHEVGFVLLDDESRSTTSFDPPRGTEVTRIGAQGLSGTAS